MAWIWTIIAIAIAVYLLRELLKSKKKLPPGPKGIPILGHLHLLGKTPHQDLHNLAKKHGPIMYMRWGFVPVVIVSSPEIAELVLKTFDHVFADRPYHEASMYIAYGQRNFIFSKYGSYWRNVRKMCTLQLLSSHKINSMQSMRRREVSLLIACLKRAAMDGGAVDLSAMVSALSAEMSFLMVVGKKYLSEEIGEKGFVAVVREVVHLAAMPNLGDFIPYLGMIDFQGLTRRMKAVAKVFDGFLEKIIEEHVQSKGEKESKDFVDTMLEIMQSGQTDFEFDRRHVKAIMLGNFIHATIERNQVEQYSNKFKEGKIYGVKNFLCVSNYLQYKTSMLPFVIKFKKDTLVKEYKKLEFPNHTFRLKSFSSILMKHEVDEKVLIDIIGRVVEIYSPVERNFGGRMSRLIDFVLEDANENQIYCTIWDDHVDQLLPYFNSTSVEPVILLLQLCRVRLLDNGEVRISSSFNATKLWFNHKCPQFSAFVESLPSMCTPIRRIDSSSRLSIVKKDFGSSSSKIEITTLQHVYARQEAVDFWIAGKILGVESLEEWYYVSCKRIGCNKKLETQNGQLYCKKCNRNWREGSISYKVVLRVQDNTMDAPLLVWDRECTDLLGVSALSLVEKYGVEYAGIPLEFGALTNRKMIFKITMNKDGQLCSMDKPINVLAIDRDSASISKHCSHLDGGDVSAGSPKLHDESSLILADDDFFVGHDVVDLGDDSDDIVELNGVVSLNINAEEDSAMVDLGVDSQIGSHSGDASAVKRCLLEEFVNVEVPKRRRILAIKEEKEA